jgi:predicted amidohydrolase YtcJ
MTLRGSVLPLICALAVAACHSSSRASADVILTNANIWTGNDQQPTARALAVIGDRIVAVGNSDEIERWRDSRTQNIDAGGKLVIPGFNDAHVHFVDGGRQLDNVDLKDAPTVQEFARRIGDRARATAPGEWILGGDWDDQMWTPAQLPVKELIDPVTPTTPVFVSRYDGHMALANSVALKLAGVTAATQEIPGGAIVRDAHGEPTGILKDAAMSYVNKVIPPLKPEQRLRAIKRALEHAASLGVTSVQHMNPDYADIAMYGSLAARGELTARIYAAPLETDWQDQARIGVHRAFGSPFLRIGALKGYADGSLGSTTAYFFEPYTDAPGVKGLLSDEMQPISGMRVRMMNADEADLQLCIHAIGDHAISLILDLFADIEQAHGARDRRFRIEHAQHVAPKDFDRFAKLNVIASVQPYHAIDDGRWAEKRIGPARIKTTYAFRTFLDRGVRLALGTDWNVAPLDPILTLYAAITRATLDGKNPNGWVPEQKISISEAVKAYTAGSAYAEFQEHDKGALARGKLADMVILSGDIFGVAPAAIRDIKVQMTMVGGKIVFRR